MQRDYKMAITICIFCKEIEDYVCKNFHIQLTKKFNIIRKIIKQWSNAEYRIMQT